MADSRRHGWRRRGLAVLVGIALLLLVELALRVAGVAGPGDRPDPFAGFSTQESLFVPGRDADGNEILQIRKSRVGAFNPQSFAARKPAGGRRVFCLGGSSTFGFPHDARRSFCGDLERALRGAHPDTPIEIVNVGGMSYGSRRVLNVMREIMQYTPDAVVVYMGHNEYVERRFFAPFLDEPAWRRALRRSLNRIRLYVVMRRALDPLLQAERNDGDLFGTGPVRDDSRRQQRSAAEDRLVAEQFRFVLDEMSALAAAGEQPLLLVRPAVNLAGWAPEGSRWRSDLGAAETRRRDGTMQQAREEAAQRPGSALAAVDEVLRIDPGAAEAHHLRGRLLLALGRLQEARESLVRALELDEVPIRLTPPLADALLDAQERFELPPLDAQAALDTLSRPPVAGNEMILDYCHPTRAGHVAIARMLLEVLHPRLWAGESPPPAARAALQQEPGEAPPESAFGAAWMAQMLLRQGDPARAEELFRAALSRDPRLATAHEGLGRLLVQRGDIEAGIGELEAAVRLAPGVDTGWNNLAGAYLAAGRDEEAVRALRKALEAGPDRPVTRVNLARALARAGRHGEARQELERVLQGNPSLAAAWTERGHLDAAAGDREAALEAYRRALDLDPGQSSAREGLLGLQDPER